MLKETAPAVSIVCNTSKIQVALCNFVKEGQTHRHKEAACILGVGIVRGVSPLPHSEAFGKGKQGWGLEPRHFEKVDTCMGKGVGCAL